MVEGLAQRVTDAAIHAGYMVGLRDGFAAATIAGVVLYLVTKSIGDSLKDRA